MVERLFSKQVMQVRFLSEARIESTYRLSLSGVKRGDSALLTTVRKERSKFQGVEIPVEIERLNRGSGFDSQSRRGLLLALALSAVCVEQM